MHGRKIITTGTVATLAILALVVACKEATTGPSSVKPQDFASNLKLISGNQQTGQLGAALTEVLSVKVVDAGGQPVPGATVLWQVRAGGGTITPPASTSSVSGLASVTWTLGSTLGANKAVAILQGNYVLDSATFTATATVGPAAKFTLVSGNNQIAKVGTALALPLVVNVKDNFGNPLAGVRVAWAVGASNGTIKAVADSTDATGNASATWTLGQSVLTAYAATATITGLAPLTFSATATADSSGPTRLFTVVSGASPAAASIGAAVATPFKVMVTDKYNNPLSGARISWNDSLTGGATPARASDTTGADGTAQITWSLGNRPGPQLMRVKELASGKTATVTANATVSFAEVLAGNYHTCARSTTGFVYCWGLNDIGQLGKGTITNTASPTTAVSMSGDSSAAAQYLYARLLAGNRSTSCVLSISQTLLCWGQRFSNLEASKLPAVLTVKANGGSGDPFAINNFQVSEDHSCLIDVSGLALCTGINTQGQLGNGSRVSPSTGSWPAVDSARTRYSNIKTGTSFTCGMRRYGPVATDSTQVPLCWGDNSMGQLGRGVVVAGVLDARPDSLPGRIKVIPAAMAYDSASLAVGDQHACIADTLGTAWCWGANAMGQLGKGSVTVRDSVPQAVTPPAGVTFKRLFAGKNHTCGLTVAGIAYCWGRDDFGQLGDGVRTGYGTGNPTPQLVGGGISFRSLTIGELFTCGVTGTPGDVIGPSSAAGTIYCWGDNSFGQIGNGAQSGGNSPVMAPTKVLYQP